MSTCIVDGCDYAALLTEYVNKTGGLTQAVALLTKHVGISPSRSTIHRAMHGKSTKYTTMCLAADLDMSLRFEQTENATNG